MLRDQVSPNTGDSGGALEAAYTANFVVSSLSYVLILKMGTHRNVSLEALLADWTLKARLRLQLLLPGRGRQLRGRGGRRSYGDDGRRRWGRRFLARIASELQQEVGVGVDVVRVVGVAPLAEVHGAVAVGPRGGGGRGGVVSDGRAVEGCCQ